MSEKDRLDWNDETDLDYLHDEPIEGFDDFEEMNDYNDMSGNYDAEIDELSVDQDDVDEIVASEPDSASVRSKIPALMVGDRRRGISSGELGIVFSASILATVAGVGSASLLAVGVDPASLWQPEKLLAWQNYLDLERNPLNVLALICLGVVALTLLGSHAIAKAASGANRRLRDAEEMLDRITVLRLENESEWQDAVFRAYPPAATFVSETLGAWRLRGSRQKHFTGLEGELHRLEKALADNSREDLTGRFDNPIAGRLSDQVIRYFDERAALSSEVNELRNKDQVATKDIACILQDARCWHDVAGQNLDWNSGAMARFAERLEEFSAELARTDKGTDPRAVFAAFKTDIQRIQKVDAATPKFGDELTELVDKTSKLAFQIAMEVARLGPRGERLTPMTQALEDLTTEFRDLADQTGEQADPDQLWTERLAQLNKKLSELEAVVQSNNDTAWREQVPKFGPAAAQLARNLTDINTSCGPQAERLTNLGSLFSEYAGTEFDPSELSSGNPDNPPAGVLFIERQMPFDDEDPGVGADNIHQPADVDPFAVTPPPTVVEHPTDPSFTGSVGEPTADIFGSNIEPEQLPKLEIETSFGEGQIPFATEKAAPEDPSLSADEEKVYDLDDFGATSAAASDQAPAADDEEVYEVSDFAGTPVADDEEVYEMEDLGAVRLEGAPDESDEPVFDIEDFGAVPLN